MKSSKIPNHKCASCGTVFHLATLLRGKAKPKAGDWNICLFCGHIQVFNADLTMRDPTDAEMVQIAGDPNMLELQKARAETLAKLPKK